MKKVLLIAGEASGDLHGAALVRELKNLDADVSITAVGSKRLREAGASMLADAAEISVVGATEVLTHLPAIHRVLSEVKRHLREERPDLLVLIDFPDFNILAGKYARSIGIPVVYYISPQVWAWRKGRARTIANLVKAVLVIFPFEVDIYRAAGADVRFVGHPLVDAARSDLTRVQAREQLGLDAGQRTVALLPGSRRKEIESLLPDMLAAARILKERFPDLQFVLPVAQTLNEQFLRTFTDRSAVPVTLVDGRVYDVLRASDAALVTSGTATLETGLMAVPMVIVYRISKLSAFIGRMIIDMKNVGLVNIVAGRTVAPELLQEDVTPGRIADAITPVLADPAEHRRVIEELARVRTLLGEGGAARRAADAVHGILHGSA